METFKIESNGELQFMGNTKRRGILVARNYAPGHDQLSSANNKFAYANGL